MKIYLGPYGITDNSQLLKRGFEEMGIETRLTHIKLGKDKFFSDVDYYDLYYVSENYSKILFKRFSEFAKSLRKFDVFIFNFSTNFFNVFELKGRGIPVLQFLDIPLLKAMGKKVVILSLGDDLRSRPLLIEECKRKGLNAHAKYIEQDTLTPDFIALSEKNRKKAKIFNKYADLIFSRPNYAQLLTRPYETMWAGMDPNNVQFNIENNEEPIIVHAPSNQRLKGTTYIEKAITRLKNEGYKFKFILCRDMDNKEVRTLLSNSSIVIDQLIMPSYGLFAIESLCGGNIVLGSVVPGHNRFPEKIPIITTTPDTIYANLKKVLEDRDSWDGIMREGRKYAEKYHDYRRTARYMVDRIRKIM